MEVKRDTKKSPEDSIFSLGFGIVRTIPNMIGLVLVVSGQILFTLGELIYVHDDSGLDKLEIIGDDD